MNEIYEQLRRAIQSSRKSRYQLWQETEIDQAQLSRFMAGKAGLSVENIEALAEALALEIIIRPKRRQPKGR